MPETLERGRFISEHTTRLLHRLAYQVSTTLHSRNADAVHDLRVAIRRFSQALVVFQPYFPARQRKKIRRRLKEIMNFAGEVRDRDIAIGLLGKEGSTEAAALEAKIRVQRKEAEGVLGAVLRRWGAKKTSSKWRSGLLPLQPATADPTQQLANMASKFFRSGDRAAAAHSSVNDLHRFRIQSKKFRYSVELFRPVYGLVADEWVDQIKRVQTLLGDMNDYRVTREMVAELGADDRTVSWFKRKEQKRADEFRKLWNDEYSGAGKQWMRSLKRVPRKPMGHAQGGGRIVTLTAH